MLNDLSPRLADSWEAHFLAHAALWASRSKDPSTKVGAVVVDPKHRTILSAGYNGFPRGVVDCVELYEDKAAKYPRIVHAEANAVANAALNGACLDGGVLYVTHPPCPDCAGLVINAGIKHVIFPWPESSDFMARWQHLIAIAGEMFEQAKIKVEGVKIAPTPTA